MGGTGCLAIGHPAGRFQSRQDDPKGLGRWASITLNGKRGCTIRVVSVYVPTKGGTGAGTVFNQQASWLEANGYNTSPIQQLILDLQEAITSWRAEDQTVIIGGDVNMPVERSQMATMMRQQGLKEAVLSRHPQAPKVATHIRSESDRVIDGIWVSESVQVVRAGYSSFGSWDHRTAWIDVEAEDLFGASSTPAKRFEGRRLRMSLAATVSKYQSELRATYAKTSLPQRVHKLWEAARRQKFLSPADRRELEDIDTLRAVAMRAAEKGSRKVYMGRVPYSPRIKQTALRKKFWDLAWKRRGGKKVSAWYNDRTKRQAGVSQPTSHMTSDEIDTARKEAHREWLEVKKSALQHRRSFLEERADEQALAGNQQAAAALIAIMKREEVVETFKAIRQAIGNADAGKVTMVIETSEDGRETIADGEDEVIRACMRANEAKYRQAYGSSLQRSHLEGAAVTTGATGVLRLADDLDEHSQALLEQLQQSGNAIPWSPQQLVLTVGDHQQQWSKARERTASGPSGLHFGLWKANAKDDLLASVDAAMREISLITGYNLKRWLWCTDVTLLKEPGNYRVHRFRTISLVEGDFNANLKWIGREMMRHTEQHSLLPEEQYGSRKQESAAEVSLNNRLTDDIIRLTASTTMICSNDAKSCYDRMAHVPLLLSMTALGVPTHLSMGVIQSVEAMQHHVLTGYGVSSTTYPAGGSKLQGLLQGLGISPAGWVAMSSPLMKAMSARDFGFSTTSPVTRETVKLVCFSFVDDTDLIHTLRTDPSDKAGCMVEIQTVVDAWEGMLRATGGALEPSKSYWYLLSFNWSDSAWEYVPAAKFPGSISIRKPDQEERSTLSRLDVQQARRALGVMVRHDGAQASNIEFYVQKSQAWADKIGRSRLQRHQAWVALQATIWKTIEYPLASSTFTKTEAERIMRPALRAALPAAGVQRNVARDLVHGPAAAMGMGVPHLYYSQIARHIDMIIRHWGQPTLTGKLLRNTMEQVALQVGIPEFYNEDWNEWRHVTTGTWIQSVWQELNHLGMTMVMEDPVISLPREGDAPIMQRFNAMGLNVKTMQAINQCRIAKQVFWVSDIARVGGTQLHPNAGKPGLIPMRQSSIKWPPVGPPGAAKWRMWKDALRKCFPESSPGVSHIQPALGRWLRFSSLVPALRKDPESDRVVRVQTGEEYSRVPRRRRTQEYLLSGTTTIVGRQLADGYMRRGRLVVTESADGIAPAASQRPANLREALQQLGDNEKWAVQHWDVMGEEDVFAKAIQDGTAKACSDGSVAHGNGASGAVISATDGHRTSKLWIAGQTPATDGTMQSHRAELAGLYSVLVVLEAVCRVYDITAGSVTVACDNTGALNALDLEWYLNPATTDSDLQRAVRARCQGLSIQVRGQHVKGHQDEGIPWNRLDLWAKLNVEADHLAGACQRQTRQQCPYSGIIKGERIAVFLQSKVTAVSYASITSQHTQDAVIRVLTRRKVVVEARHVDWEAVGRAMTTLDRNKRTLTFKLVTGEAAVGRRMLQWKHRNSAQCPSCTSEETTMHFWTCQSPTRKSIADGQVAKLRQWLLAYPTQPAMVHVMMQMLLSQMRGTHCLVPFNAGEELAEAVRQQSSAGPQSMLRGMLATHWRQAQSAFLHAQGSRKSALKWAAQVTRRIWHIAWQQWSSRNEDMFHSETSAEGAMEAEVRARTASLEDQLRRTPGQYDRQLSTRPSDDLPVEAHLVWIEQAAARLRTAVASGALLKWINLQARNSRKP